MKKYIYAILLVFSLPFTCFSSEIISSDYQTIISTNSVFIPYKRQWTVTKADTQKALSAIATFLESPGMRVLLRT